MKTELLPPNILKCMSKAERKGVETAEERLLRQEMKKEGDLHRQTEALLRIRNIEFVHSRFGLKPTIQAGLPDFMILLPGGKAYFIELKTLHGVISTEQHAMMERLRGLGFEVIVATDLNQIQAALNLWGGK